jgi:hypothetical protein
MLFYPEAARKSRRRGSSSIREGALAVAGNEVILTCVTNGDRLEDGVNVERLYWPRFVRVSIDKR